MTSATTVYRPITENKIKKSEPFVLRFGMCSGHGLLVRVSRQLGFLRGVSPTPNPQPGGHGILLFRHLAQNGGRQGVVPTRSQAVAIFCFDHFYYRITKM